MKRNNELFNENAVLALHPDYKTEIARIVRSNLAPRAKQEQLSDYHENDIAAALDLLNKEDGFSKNQYEFYVSDAAEKFMKFADSILPYDVDTTKLIPIEEY